MHERANATILGNSITENQYGIQSLGDTTIGGASGGEGNTISSNDDAGIEVESGGEATITHDAITRNGTGILVGSSATDTSVVDRDQAHWKASGSVSAVPSQGFDRVHGSCPLPKPKTGFERFDTQVTEAGVSDFARSHRMTVVSYGSSASPRSTN